MKAVTCDRYGTAEVLKVKTLPKPVPNDDEILLKNYASAVIPSDCVSRSGKPYFVRLFSGFFKPGKAIPGVKLSGEIEAVGKNVTLFKAGDHVFGTTGVSMGAHAEYKCMNENDTIVKKPSNLNFIEAAAISDGGLTSLCFLRDKVGLKKGQKILINGASGAVGIYAVQIAKYYGAEVTGVCSSTNVQLVRDNGADHVIDYTVQDFTKSNETYDIVYDAIGKSSFSACKNVLTSNGYYLTTVPGIGILLQMLRTKLFGSKTALFAATGLQQTKEKIDFLRELAENGHVKPVIDRKYALEQIVEAHHYVETERKKGNVILTIANSNH